MELYERYKKRWLQIELNYKRICFRYRKKDRTIEPYKSFFMSEKNNMDFSSIPKYLSILTQIEAMMITRAYIYI